MNHTPRTEAIRSLPRAIRAGVAVLMIVATMAAKTLGAQGGPVSATITGADRVIGPVKASVLSLPSLRPRATTLTVTPEGLALVPLGGGVVIAGFGGWYIEPRLPPIISLAYDDGLRLVLAQPGTRGGVVVWKELDNAHAEGAPRRLTWTLPSGMYQLATASDGAMWAWGQSDGGEWLVMLLPAEDTARVLERSNSEITAFTPLRGAAAVVAIGTELFILRIGSDMERLARLRAPVLGLSVDSIGTLYLSSIEGIFRMPHLGRLELVAVGPRGPIAIRGRDVYVLDRERVLVLQIGTEP